jgi:acyl carrier protein
MTSIRSDIISQFEQVAREQKRTLAPLSEETELLSSGLDSLCFAIIIARLEDRLGYDPFGTVENSQPPVTLGDFIRMYEDASK